jgi:hypothetical protein
LLEDVGERDRLREAARRAASRYLPDRCHAQYAILYERVLS